MANLRTAMDSTFYDLNISSPQTLDGTARLVPGEPIPLDGSKASRALRVQQLSFLGNGFPLGLIPSYSPTTHKDLGNFSIQSLLLKPSFNNWWLGLSGQFRPKKLISSIKAEFSAVDEFELPAFKDVTKHFFNKSLYAIGLCTQLTLGSDSAVVLSTEGHGERKGRRSKAMFFHKLPQHDLTLEAAWPELFIDRKGNYWDVPESISLDMSSLISKSGLRYRFGVHKNTGEPQSYNTTNGEAPLALMPGICAKASFSYEKSRDIWRQREKPEDSVITNAKGKKSPWPAYDVRLKEPHSTISGIMGGTATAWFGGPKERSPLNADLFGSICYTFQHGKFRKLYGDLTRIDTRLDVSSASALIKGESPRLNVVFQQQVLGPIMFRADSKFCLSPKDDGSHVEDLRYSLSYSLRLLRSGKVVAWYSPKRKEGMVELRVFEF